MANGLADYVGRDTNLSGFYNSILSGIQRQQEIAAKKQEAEDERARQIVKGIEGELSKVSSDGLRNADIGLFNKSYSKIKDSYYKMLTAATNDERLQAAAEMRNEINATNDLVSRSKAIGKQDYDFGEDIRKNPGGYADDVRTKFSQRISTPLDKLSPELLNPQNFARRVDTSKVQGNIVKMAQDIAKASNNVTPSVSRMNLPSGGADVVEFVREDSREAFIEGMVQQTAADPAYQAYIRENFPGLSSEEAINLIADQMQEAGQLTARSGRQVIRDRAPSSSGSGSDSATVGEIAYNIPVNIGGRQVTATRGVDLTTSNVVVPNRQAVDAETGQIVNLGEIKAQTGVRQGQITGILEIPSLNDPFGVGNNEVVEYQIHIPNPNYLSVSGMEPMGPRNYTKTYYIRKDLLPEGAQNIKAVRGAVSKFDSSRGSVPQNNSVSSQPTDATTAKPKLDW